MKKLISDARYAECAAIRATYVAKPVEWSTDKRRNDYIDGDFGDYIAGVWRDPYTLGNKAGAIHWSVSFRIINELLGAGRLHVSYGFANSFDDAKEQITAKVELDRAKRAEEASDA